MDDVDFSAPATVRMSSRTIPGRCVFGRLENVPLAEAVRAVVEDLHPWQARFSLIETAEGSIRLAEIVAIYERPEFPIAKRPKPAAVPEGAGELPYVRRGRKCRGRVPESEPPGLS